jgi:membrane protein
MNQSLRTRITVLFSGFSAWLWGETSAGCRGTESLLRVWCRVVFIAGREFSRDRIPLRASALTFTVILSLVPLLALGTSVLTGLGAGGQMRQAAHALISQMEATAEVVSDSTGLAAPAARPWHGESDSLSDHLHLVVETIFDYVDKTRFATMGLVGILVLLFTVYTLLGSIEKTFNAIWQTDANRTFGRKLVDYLALLVLLPLTINFGVAAMAALKSPRLLAQVQQWLPWLGVHTLNLLPLVAMVATFSFLYGFLPNTRVSKRAALIGGVVGGLTWLLLQAVYFKLQIVVVRYNAIYGSFAALPLFLLWIYLSWVVFLLGAEVSFATQIWRRYHWWKQSLSPIGRVALAFEILLAAAEDYRQQRLTTRDNLGGQLNQPDQYIKELLDTLVGAGVMRYVPEGEGGYLPSAPLAELSPVAIGRLMLGEVPEAISADNPARLALAAMANRLAEISFGHP